MNKMLLKFLRLYQAFADLLLLNIVFTGTQYFFQYKHLVTPSYQYNFFCLFLNTAWLAIALIENIYAEKIILSFEFYARKFIKAYSYFLVVVVAFLFFFRMLEISRFFISVIMVATFFTLFLNRVLFLYIQQHFKNNTDYVRNVIVIGYNGLSKKVVHHLERESITKRVIGFAEDYENVNELTNYPILSNIQQTMAVCKKYDVSEIYSTISPENNSLIYDLIKQADQNCIRFKIVPDLGVFVNRKMHINYVSGLPVMSMRIEPLEDAGNRIKKRLFDVIVSALVIIFILSWLLPIIGLLIILESKGPVFFSQKRSGKDNKDFLCFKFRSMYVNEISDSKQASRDDARITRIGKFLRRTSLDEFPQFINVLKGDMSIVGPRPHMLKHTDEYSRLIEKYMVRQFLKPGITGWAQVKGFRGETINVEHMEKRVEHDLYYMENWSLLLDIKIVFLTIFNTIKGEENAF